MAAYREEEDPFEEDIVFDQAGLLNNTSKINTAIRRVSSGKCVLFAKTLGLCGAFFGLGLCIAIPGPTFLSPLTALEVNVSNIYVARSSGYLIGAVIGGMLFDHFNRLFLLFLSLLLTSVFITVAPWCQILWLQVACMVTLGITMGFLDTGGNVLCLDLWGRNSGPFMQALHFSFGLGAFVAPLLAVPFLETVSLNTTFTTNVSQIVTEYPIRSFKMPEGDVFLFDRLERIKREAEGFNESIIFNKSQLTESLLQSNNSFLMPKLLIPTETITNDSLHNSEINASISVTPDSETDIALGLGTTASVLNTTVKQKALRHKPKTDGRKLGNTNWEGVHVGVPPLADLMPATTTVTTKSSIDLVLTTPISVLPVTSKFSNGSREIYQENVSEASSQLPDPSEPTSPSVTLTSETSVVYTPTISDETVYPSRVSVTTDEKVTFANFDSSYQENGEFLDDIHSPFLRNESGWLSGDHQKVELTAAFSSTVESIPQSELHLSLPDPEDPFTSTSIVDTDLGLSQPSKVDNVPKLSDEESVTKSAEVPTDFSVMKNDNSQLKYPEQPPMPSYLNEHSSTKEGSSLGHDEYYIQKSGTGESLDRNEKTFAGSRILSSNDNSPKVNNESKLESKIDDHIYNPLLTDTPSIPDFVSSNHNISHLNSQIISKENDTKSDFESIPQSELQFSLSGTPTVVPEQDKMGSLNYLNPAAVSKHVHRKPGTFDNDTEHINTIFDVFANRIEKYGFSKLQFSYLIVGIFVFSVSIVFLGFLCHNPRDPKSKQEEGQGSKKIINKTVHKMLVSLMAFFLFMYMGMEVTYRQLVLAYAMHSNLKLSQSTGSVISVVFWGSFAAMRFASIFFASGFSPLTMLILNFVFCTTGTLLVSALANHVETALWVGTALIGIGLASMFPTGILWIERYIHVSNKVAATFVIGVSLGQMICPITVYRLMVNNPQMLMHSALVINILCILTFVALWWLASRQGEKYSVVINNGYQLANQNDEEEDMLDMSPSGSAVTFRRHSFSSEHRALLNGNVHRGP